MTREELKMATTEKLISALEYCGRDSYYATYYDEVVNEITKRLKQNKEMQNKIKDLEGQLQEIAKDNDNYQKENKELQEEIAGLRSREYYVGEKNRENMELLQALNVSENQVSGLEKQNKALREELAKKSDTNHTLIEQMAIMQEKIDTMKELLNRYYMVCAEIPKEYRTMVFDSCMEDTRQLSNKGWLKI